MFIIIGNFVLLTINSDTCVMFLVLKQKKKRYRRKKDTEQKEKQGKKIQDIRSYSSRLHSFFREGSGSPLQYSCLENPMGGGAWWAAVHGVAAGRTRLSDFTSTFHFHALEKEMAIHSSVLAWRISGMGEPGGLPSMGSHRVGND